MSLRALAKTSLCSFRVKGQILVPNQDTVWWGPCPTLARGVPSILATTWVVHDHGSGILTWKLVKNAGAGPHPDLLNYNLPFNDFGDEPGMMCMHIKTWGALPYSVSLPLYQLSTDFCSLIWTSGVLS